MKRPPSPTGPPPPPPLFALCVVTVAKGILKLEAFSWWVVGCLGDEPVPVPVPDDDVCLERAERRALAASYVSSDRWALRPDVDLLLFGCFPRARLWLRPLPSALLPRPSSPSPSPSDALLPLRPSGAAGGTKLRRLEREPTVMVTNGNDVQKRPSNKP